MQPPIHTETELYLVGSLLLKLQQLSTVITSDSKKEEEMNSCIDYIYGVCGMCHYSFSNFIFVPIMAAK